MIRIFGGLTWPESGYPAFFCLVTEREQLKTETLDTPFSYLEILKEVESYSLPTLFEEIKKLTKVTAIYTQKLPKHVSFLRDYGQWRRENQSDIALRSSRVSSFEAGIIKIKEMVTEKKLQFPEVSVVRSQLRVFSKLSLKEEKEFYAVSALTQVIGAFRQYSKPEEDKVQKMKAWY
jgi:hypothetical protein